MKNAPVHAMCLVVFAMLITLCVYAADCTPDRSFVTLVDTGCKSDLTIEKREGNTITYPDDFIDFVVAVGFGGCSSEGVACYPEFFTPQKWSGHWEQDIVDKRIVGPGTCTYISFPNESRKAESNHTCSLTEEESCGQDGGHWNSFAQTCEYPDTTGCSYGTWGFDHHPWECYNGTFIDCECNIWVESPVLIDTAGDGFALTDAAGGVDFDLSASGVARRVAWTAAGTDDAWLVLDRDGNGTIDDGRELFGNHTAQPEPPAGGERNGFLALAEFDRQAGGGNADGVIDSHDAVFSSLRLWRDANHDGVAQPGELSALPALDVLRLHLDYKESKRVDGHGNRFRYRAKVDDAKKAKVGRWAWDVFLTFGAEQ
jgi:hypothetical protein